MTAHDETAAVTWAPVQEAAEQAGVSVNAVRKWAARDQIRSRTGQGPRGGRLEVAVEDVADRAEVVLADGSRHSGAELQPLTDLQRATAEQFAQLGTLIHQAGQDIAEWRARAEVAETKLRFLGDQLAAARELPEQLRDDLVAARADIGQARAETVELRAELEAARDRIVELQQQVRTAATTVRSPAASGPVGTAMGLPGRAAAAPPS